MPLNREPSRYVTLTSKKCTNSVYLASIINRTERSATDIRNGIAKVCVVHIWCVRQSLEIFVYIPRSLLLCMHMRHGIRQSAIYKLCKLSSIAVSAYLCAFSGQTPSIKLTSGVFRSRYLFMSKFGHANGNTFGKHFGSLKKWL